MKSHPGLDYCYLRPAGGAAGAAEGSQGRCGDNQSSVA
jgi:hypothetical protein